MTKYWSKKYTLDEYEKMTWKTPSDELDDAVENLLAWVEEAKPLLKLLGEYYIKETELALMHLKMDKETGKQVLAFPEREGRHEQANLDYFQGMVEMIERLIE